MISHEELLQQLKKIKCNPNGWGRTEIHELCNILIPEEEIEELVNGYYEAGFALLVATKDRVLLVDKKPLNYLTVEDMRFDMISEFEYSHRIIGAHVSITSGNKTLHFTSLNQARLRRLLSYVQARMTDIKRTQHLQQESQQQNLEQMSEQLKEYLLRTNQEVARLRQQAPSAGPYYSQGGGYMLPNPSTEYAGTYGAPTPPQPTETLRDRTAFEHAAAASMGLTPDNQPTQQASSMLHKIAVTPQQIGLAAVRLVIPRTSPTAVNSDFVTRTI